MTSSGPPPSQPPIDQARSTVTSTRSMNASCPPALRSVISTPAPETSAFSVVLRAWSYTDIVTGRSTGTNFATDTSEPAAVAESLRSFR